MQVVMDDKTLALGNRRSHGTAESATSQIRFVLDAAVSVSW